MADRPPPCGNYGDINGDGKVDNTEVWLLEQYLYNEFVLTDDQLKKADVDGDGEVTPEDLNLVARYILGDIDTFPVCNRVSTCPWDLNGDDVVDDADRDILMAAYDSRPGDANWNPACDFNGDGVVDILDLGTMGAHVGPCPSTERVISIDIPVGAVLKIDGVEII